VRFPRGLATVMLSKPPATPPLILNREAARGGDVRLIQLRLCETKSGDLPEAFASRQLFARGSKARGSTVKSAPARPNLRKGRQEFFFARIWIQPLVF